jgi:pSer/pThr/pTyr-binding forkhead associated (FHA) protein
MMVLRYRNGEGRLACFELEGHGSVTVGRSPDADITLPDRRVSRIHCRILRDGAAYVVIDAGSKNGTCLNDRRIERGEIQAGDVIKVGPAALFVGSLSDHVEGRHRGPPGASGPETTITVRAPCP